MKMDSKKKTAPRAATPETDSNKNITTNSITDDGEKIKIPYRSRVYTDRPRYADYDSANKFLTLEGIIVHRLIQHPNAICSYSGGSDSDIMIDLIERTRRMFNSAGGKESIGPVKYVFFNTGLEMKATKDHVKATAEKYGVTIEEVRPKINIVKAARDIGIPFVSKIMSQGLEGWQKKGIPLSIAEEYAKAEDKAAKRKELKERYPKCESIINFLCCCNSKGEPRPNIQLVINSSKYMLDFIREYPPDFQISAKCCDYCKKQIAHRVQKDYEMIITGERMAEGGMRSVPRSEQWNANNTMCFAETFDGQFRFRPLFYVSDKDKAWYKEHYGIKYSDAYEVYGLTRTGCCGCPISYKAVEDLEKIRPYEPNVVKAAWNIFGDSYRYRKKYNEYKREKMESEKKNKNPDSQSLADEA
jgi:3'-phosphoadenosine 5'-phosphosulfate sulfotransferase (PAPS reductase)/FAD synthetase